MFRMVVPSILVCVLLAGETFAVGSASYTLPYSEWQFKSRAENATWNVRGTSARVTIVEGYIHLSSILSRKVMEGMRVSLNISVDRAASTITSGLEIIIGNGIVEKKDTSTGQYSLSFYLMKNYNSGTPIMIVIYSYGGNCTVTLNSFHFEIQKGGITEGLFLTGMGITVVFAVLGLLAGVMYVLKSKTHKNNAEEKMMMNDINIEKKKIDDETLTAITAVLNMYLQGKKFRIINVKSSPWKYYGRINIMRRLK